MRLFAWEEELVMESSSVLENYFLQEHVNDSWNWHLDPFEGYSLKKSIIIFLKRSGGSAIAQVNDKDMIQFLTTGKITSSRKPFKKKTPT
jgi:hypothetical protein